MRSNKIDEALYGKKYSSFRDEKKSCGCGCRGFSNHSDSESHFDGMIGVINNGMPVITADKGNMQSNWEKAVNDRTDSLVSFSRIEARFERGVYYLLATDSKSSNKAIVELVEDKGGLYEKRINGGGLTIVCSGCSGVGECDPKMTDNKDWYCSPCGSSRDSCTKTITYSFRSILGKHRRYADSRGVPLRV